MFDQMDLAVLSSAVLVLDDAASALVRSGVSDCSDLVVQLTALANGLESLLADLSEA